MFYPTMVLVFDPLCCSAFTLAWLLLPPFYKNRTEFRVLITCARLSLLAPNRCMLCAFSILHPCGSLRLLFLRVPLKGEGKGTIPVTYYCLISATCHKLKYRFESKHLLVYFSSCAPNSFRPRHTTILYARLPHCCNTRSAVGRWSVETSENESGKIFVFFYGK